MNNRQPRLYEYDYYFALYMPFQAKICSSFDQEENAVPEPAHCTLFNAGSGECGEKLWRTCARRNIDQGEL